MYFPLCGPNILISQLMNLMIYYDHLINLLFQQERVSFIGAKLNSLT